MSENVIRRPFNKRALVSTALLASGLLLPVTGLMNHLLQFDDLTLARHFWMSAHDVAGILFVICSVLHITYNWRALATYVKKAKQALVSREALIAMVMVAVIVGLVSSHAFHVK